MSFFHLIDDDELRTEIREILGKLELLTETRASAPGRSSRSSETPIGPPEFAGLSQKDCPPEDRSLFDHFRWRFEREVHSGRSRKRLWFLLWEAQKAYETRTIPPGPENPRMALVLTRADERGLVKHILEDREGEHSFKVHLDLNLPVGYIEKVREDAGCEPEHGRKRPKWSEMDEPMKRMLVVRLRNEGRTQDEVAKWLGVSRRTVATYGKQPDDAA